MEKTLKRIPLDYDFSWLITNGIEIKQIKEDIIELEKLGATHIEIEGWVDDSGTGIEVTAILERIETDEELTSRILRADKWKEDVKRKELDQLARLKLKYEI